MPNHTTRSAAACAGARAAGGVRHRGAQPRCACLARIVQRRAAGRRRGEGGESVKADRGTHEVVGEGVEARVVDDEVLVGVVVEHDLGAEEALAAGLLARGPAPGGVAAGGAEGGGVRRRGGADGGAGVADELEDAAVELDGEAWVEEGWGRK